MRLAQSFARHIGSFAVAAIFMHGMTDILAADSVVVETTAGRVFFGQFDAHSTRKRLVLRSGTSDMYIARPIDWRHVAWVRIDGKPLSPAQLLARFDAEGWPRPIDELPAPRDAGPRPAPSPPVPHPPGPSDAFDSVNAGRAPRTTDAWPPARSLAIDAWAGKWTSYVDNDGIVVRIFPLDAYGNIVPVSGMLEVDLIGTQSASLTRGEPFPRLARWARRVNFQDVGGEGAVYRFAYQAWHPEFDLQLGSLGAVHARLSVPGQGVFDDTASMVWVRPYSSARDRLQMHTGGRFFRGLERTSRGMNDSRLGIIAPP